MIHLPTVSVIIPTYNHAHFLNEALLSVCEQSYKNWEVIVINNFSEDETISVVESFADKRIRLENFRNHGIIAKSRNRGIELARGQYIAFLDSDDSWYPEKLSNCLNYINNGADLVCHGLEYHGLREKNVFCGPIQLASFDKLLFRGNCIITSATVVRKDFLCRVGCFSEESAVVTAEDYHLWLKLAQGGAKMVFLREILGRYRVHSGGQSNSVLRHLKAVLFVVENFLPSKKKRSFLFQMRVRRRRAVALYGAGRSLQNIGNIDQSWSLFLRSISYAPFYLKNYLALMYGLFIKVTK